MAVGEAADSKAEKRKLKKARKAHKEQQAAGSGQQAARPQPANVPAAASAGTHVDDKVNVDGAATAAHDGTHMADAAQHDADRDALPRHAWLVAAEQYGERVSDTACDLASLGDDEDVVLVHLPPEVDPAVLNGKPMQLPGSDGQPCVLEALQSAEVAQDAELQSRSLYVLSAAGGRVTAAPVAASYTVRQHLDEMQSSQEPVNDALLDELMQQEHADGDSAPPVATQATEPAMQSEGHEAAQQAAALGESRQKKKRNRKREKLLHGEQEALQLVGADVEEDMGDLQVPAPEQTVTAEPLVKKKKKKRRKAADDDHFGSKATPA